MTLMTEIKDTMKDTFNCGLYTKEYSSEGTCTFHQVSPIKTWKVIYEKEKKKTIFMWQSKRPMRNE